MFTMIHPWKHTGTYGKTLVFLSIYKELLAKAVAMIHHAPMLHNLVQSCYVITWISQKLCFSSELLHLACLMTFMIVPCTTFRRLLPVWGMVVLMCCGYLMTLFYIIMHPSLGCWYLHPTKLQLWWDWSKIFSTWWLAWDMCNKENPSCLDVELQLPKKVQLSVQHPIQDARLLVAPI